MNPYLKRIRWRLLWISFACLSLAVGSFALNQWVYAGSDDQCSWQVEKGKIVIREILPDGVAEEAGLLEGDELVKIQGHSYEPTQAGTLKAQAFINGKSEGTILIYSVRRQGRLILVPVRLVKSLDLAQLALLLNGLIAWAVSLLVVISAPERKSSRHFFYLAATTLLMSGAILSGTAPLGIQVVVFLMGALAGALLPPLWIHFFLRFPHPLELRKNRRFLRILYTSFAVMALLQLVPRLLGVANGGMISPPPGLMKSGLGRALGLLLALLPTVLFVGAAITGLVFFVKGAFHAPERLRRALRPSLFVAAALCLDLLAWVLLRGRFGQSLLFQRQLYVFMLPLPLLPLSFAHAIFRHGLFDVRKVLLRWLSYVALLALTVAAYLGGLAWAFSHLASIPSGWAGALVGLLALPLGWALRRLVKGIRRRFRMDFSSTREIALSAVREPRKKFSEESLLKSLRRALGEAFQPQLLEILPLVERQILLPSAEGSDREGRRTHFPPQPLRIPPGLLRLARENQELVLGLGSEEADWIREQGGTLRAHVDALEAQLMLLLLAGDDPHSVVVLGGKYAELNYGREDRELLREVAQAAGQALPQGHRANPVYLPAPHRVARAFYTAFTTPPRLPNEPWLHQSLGHSIRTILLGFVASSILGVPLGILCGAYRFFFRERGGRLHPISRSGFRRHPRRLADLLQAARRDKRGEGVPRGHGAVRSGMERTLVPPLSRKARSSTRFLTRHGRGGFYGPKTHLGLCRGDPESSKQ